LSTGAAEGSELSASHRDSFNSDSASQFAGVAALVPLYRELNDLKRIRVAGRNGSIAERLFLRAWARLARGEAVGMVALSETAHAVAAARLAGIDAGVLADGGLDADTRGAILENGFDAVSGVLDPTLRAQLRTALSADAIEDVTGAPEFAALLSRQPRAGATRPGYARIVLEPAENHAEHCGIVAVNGALAAPLYGGTPEDAFLTGLCHHFHNAYLPDAGDAGDHLLGEHLQTLQETFRVRALGQLDEPLRSEARLSLEAVFASDTPNAKAFQTADVLDRVLEMEWHARSAEFTLGHALHDMDIVHPGPVQQIQLQIMRAAGLM
jgi:hypothetical protein